MVATFERYLKAVLRPEDLIMFRLGFRELRKTVPLKELPWLEPCSAERVSSSSSSPSKGWLLSKAADLESRGPKLIQKTYKPTVWLPGPPEEPTEGARTLEAYAHQPVCRLQEGGLLNLYPQTQEGRIPVTSTYCCSSCLSHKSVH